MSNIIDIRSFEPKSSHSYFFDNNVWMYLHGPVAGYSAQSIQKHYSAFYKSVLSVNAGLFVNSLVLSEFSNAILRIEFEKWKKLPSNSGKNNYKDDFIPSQKFKESVIDVKNLLKAILATAHKGNDDFNSVNLNNIYSEFGRSDFNDSYYLEFCRLRNLKIVTHDADFFKNNIQGIEIITANI